VRKRGGRGRSWNRREKRCHRADGGRRASEQGETVLGQDEYGQKNFKEGGEKFVQARGKNRKDFGKAKRRAGADKGIG